MIQTKPTRQRQHRSEPQWRKLLEQFNTSNLTQAQFCKDHHISSGSFHKWKNRLSASGEGSPPNPFVEVTPPEQSPVITSDRGCPEIPQPWDIELELAKGCTLRVRLS